VPARPTLAGNTRQTCLGALVGVSANQADANRLASGELGVMGIRATVHWWMSSSTPWSLDHSMPPLRADDQMMRAPYAGQPLTLR